MCPGRCQQRVVYFHPGASGDSEGTQRWCSGILILGDLSTIPWTQGLPWTSYTYKTRSGFSGRADILCPQVTVVTTQRFSFPERVVEVMAFPVTSHCSRVTETERKDAELVGRGLEPASTFVFFSDLRPLPADLR